MKRGLLDRLPPRGSPNSPGPRTHIVHARMQNS
jgi:hypothetical protein